MLAVTGEGAEVSGDMLPHLRAVLHHPGSKGEASDGDHRHREAKRQRCVQSDLNRGRTFRIYLPSTSEELTEGSRTGVAAGAPTLKQTILVVEDDPGIRELTSRVLSRYGYSVLTASGGDEARTIGETDDGAIDLLLSDVVMPCMSGPNVADMLNAMRPTMKDYMSGYSDEAIARHGVVVHDAPFLQKLLHARATAQQDS
jgi:CheY-like chemotaxis protein